MRTHEIPFILVNVDININKVYILALPNNMTVSEDANNLATSWQQCKHEQLY